MTSYPLIFVEKNKVTSVDEVRRVMNKGERESNINFFYDKAGSPNVRGFSKGA